jgi:signal transduction histidine kinase
MASHEIRTPLVAIRGNSQMLKQMYAEHNDADFGQMVDDIHTSSERLIRVVTNFLDLARLEQNRIPFTVESFELDPVVHSVVQEMHNMGNEHGVQIVADIPPVLPAILADKDRVKQILYNLIGNSMKFTEEGSITVGAHADKAHVVVTVTDTGRGIRPEDQKALFEKFRQTSKSDARIGTGLGLYISKILVEKMGGSMRLESSEVGKGTTFSFTLPLATESPKPTNKISPQIQS